MRLSKSQLAVITILNVVIAALVAVIFLLPGFFPPSFGDTDDASAPPADQNVPAATTPHNKLRDASPGKASGIVRETQLMGSGDETALGVFRDETGVRIFGNATVGDYDFDGYGGFMCTLDFSGKITAYEYFSGRMTAVAIVNGGYAVATTFEPGTPEERNALYYLEYDSAPREVIVADGTIRDIMVAENGRVAIVSQRNDNCITLAEYVVGEKWQREHSTDIASGYSMEYFDCYMLGDEYTIAVRASSLPRYDAVAFFTFRAGGDPTAHFYGGSGDNLLQPYAVMPCPFGYIVLAKRSGQATIIGVDYTYTGYRRDVLGFAPSGGRLTFDGERYFATFGAVDGDVTYSVSQELDERTHVTALDGKTALYGGDGMLFVATSKTLEVLRGADASKIASFGISGARVHGRCKNPDGTVTVALSALGGNAVGAPVGGRDIYVLCLSI